LLRNTIPISQLRGHWVEYAGIPLMPTFHPAYLLRNPSSKREVWEDMKQVMRRLREKGESFSHNNHKKLT
jgi:DNA polymerase